MFSIFLENCQCQNSLTDPIPLFHKINCIEMKRLPLIICISLALIWSTRTVLAAGSNSFLLGSNLVCDSMNDPFLINASHRDAAAAVLGVVRFPCRSFTPSQVVQIADAVTAKNMEPLVILSAHTTVQNDLANVKALVGHATYFEFGNENNYAQGWSGAQYAAAWKTYVRQFRAAYPGIRIGGPVGSHFSATGSNYLRDFLNAIKGDPGLFPDFISMHVYAEHGEDTSDQAVMDKVHSWGAGIDVMKSDCMAILGVSLPIAITEWNWDAAPERTSDNRQGNTAFQHDFNFAVLDQFKTHGVWMSCEYDFDGGAGGGKLDMYNKPQFTAFADWKKANPLGAKPTPTGTGR